MASNLMIIDSDSEDDTEQKTQGGSPERLTSPETRRNEEDECSRTQTQEVSCKSHEKEEETAASIDISASYSSVNEHRKKIPKRDAKILSKLKSAKYIEKTLADLEIEADVKVRGESCLYATATKQESAVIAVDVTLNLISEEEIQIHEPYERILDRQRQQNLESEYLVDIEVQSNVISVKGIGGDVSTVRHLIEKNMSEKNGHEHQTLQFQFNKGQSRCYKRDPDFISKVTSVQSHNLKVTRTINTNKCLVIDIDGEESDGKLYLENLKSLRQEIWDGKLDLYRISKDDTDVAIMSYGLQKEEKQFIKMAECQLQCGIVVGNSCKKVRLPFQSWPCRQNFEEEDLFSDLPASEEELQSPSFSDWGRSEHPEKLIIRDSTIQVLNVDVTLYKAKCLVNFFDRESGLSTRGRIFKRFMTEGGEELSVDLSSNYDPSKNIIITTNGGKLQCQYVCHISLPKYKGKSSIQELQRAVREGFSECSDLGVCDIAIPALGVGRLLQYPVEEVASLLISESISLVERNTQWKITYAIYDKENFSVFKHHLDLRRQGKQETEYSKRRGIRRGYSVPDFHYIHTSGKGGQRNSIPDSRIYRDHKSSKLEQKQGRPHPKNTKGSPQDNAGDQSKMAPVIELHIYALTRDKGESIRSELSQMIKERFLHEHGIERINFSEMSKEKTGKMYEIGQKCGVFVSLDKGKSRILLKGSAKEVSKAGQEIESICPSASPQEPQVRRKENRHRHGTEDYWKRLVEEPPVPTYWKHFKDGKSLFDCVKGLFTTTEKCYEVDPKTFHAIRKLVEKTFNPELVGHGADARNLTHQKIHVQKVELIENIDLYHEYSMKRRKMLVRSIDKRKDLKFPTKLQRVPKKHGIQNVVGKGAIFTEKIIDERLTQDIISELNEVYLFHGTKTQFVRNIVSKGVDPKHGSDGGMFGRGIYCAESSTKADQYADDKDQRGQKGKMFLMRLLLGNIFLTERDKKYKQPPCYHCHKDDCAHPHHERFDSVVGVKQQTGGLFREFVVYDKDQCYPEYLITYTRL